MVNILSGGAWFQPVSRSLGRSLGSDSWQVENVEVVGPAHPLQRVGGMQRIKEVVEVWVGGLGWGSCGGQPSWLNLMVSLRTHWESLSSLGSGSWPSASPRFS